MAAVLVVQMGVAMVVLPLGSNGCSVATLPAALVVGLLLEVAMVQGVLVASSEGSTFNAHEPPRWPGDYRLGSKPPGVFSQRAPVRRLKPLQLLQPLIAFICYYESFALRFVLLRCTPLRFTEPTASPSPCLLKEAP
jgi:hypothetical protein